MIIKTKYMCGTKYTVRKNCLKFATFTGVKEQIIKNVLKIPLIEMVMLVGKGVKVVQLVFPTS
jgi:hypothetical protein